VDFLVSHRYKGLAIICPLLVWMNECQMDHYNFFVATKTSSAILAHDGTNRFNKVHLNFTLQCQHFDIFLSYQ